MGFCINGDDHFDVFLSYANADNIAHNLWVSDFERYLKEKVIAELSRQDDTCADRASFVRICRDETGFPESGNLAAVIDEKVRHSQFLFIFLGEGYLNSEWCLSELDIFREATGGTIQGALERLYLIVLDRNALFRLREGDEPKRLLQKRKNLWKSLQAITEKAIRIEDFLRPNDFLLPVYRDQYNRADVDFHKFCTPLVKELTKKLLEQRELSERNRKHRLESQSSPRENPIVIGPVPSRLKAVRDMLLEALKDNSVRTIEEDELGQQDIIQEYLTNTRLLVMPFDRYEPIIQRGDPAGGHLAVLQKIFKEVHCGDQSTTDASIIWWEPPIQNAAEPKAISNYDKVFIKGIDALPEEQRRHCGALELATELLKRNQKKLLTARVWIEWEESDEKTIVEAQNIVKKYFDAHCQAKEKEGLQLNAVLHFGVADWEMLEKTLPGKPDGIVIVYNENKDFNAFTEQWQTISNLEEVLAKKMFPGIFYMRPKGMFQPSENWRVVRFTLNNHKLEYKQEQLQEFVSNLFDLLYHKYR